MDGDIFSFQGQVDLKFGPGKDFPGFDDEDDEKSKGSEAETESSGEESETDIEPKRRKCEIGVNAVDSVVSPENCADVLETSEAVEIDDFLITPPPSLNNMPGKRRKKSRTTENLLNKLKANLQVISSPSSGSFQVCMPVTDDDHHLQTKVKVRCHGIIEKWELRENEPFSVVIKNIARKEGLSPERISLLWKENQIRLSDTVASLKLSVADIIECIILDDANSVTFTTDDSDVINLKIQMQGDKHKPKYCVSKHVPLRAIVVQYCSSKNIDIQKIKLYFDGDKISIDKAPSELEMEDEDVIDVIVAK